MVADRFITLAIHTYERAVALRKILESHGIEVRFESLVLTGAHIASGVRVKINEKNLALALRIIESGDFYTPVGAGIKIEGTTGSILIPVDFSLYSMLACKVGFELAERLQLHPVVMHAYATPYFTGSLAYDNVMDIYGSDDIVEMRADHDVRVESERLMRDFKRKIDAGKNDGTLPDISYSTLLNEGIPEEIILEYCRQTPPALVVMATRGKHKKEEELVGSVTAEVIDSCRVPVLAFPENMNFKTIDSLRHVAYFCNLDQHDIISVDTLMRVFDYPSVEMTLVPVNDRAGNNIKEKVDALCEYFGNNYPAAKFRSGVFPSKTFRQDIGEYIQNEGIEMLIVPNKKKNIFSRLFNPGIPHKILFERDMPILALPV